MAKLVCRTMDTNAYVTIRPFFDEVAEDCSLLSVSNDGTTLTLTIDTDLVVVIAQYTSSGVISSYIGSSSITFNGNNLATKSSQSTGAYPTYVVLYSDSMFLFSIKANTSSPAIWAFYEKIGNFKCATGNIGSGVNLIALRTMSNDSIQRLPNSLGMPTELGYIDYIESTALCSNTAPYPKVAPIDTNLFFGKANPTISDFNIVTIGDNEYLSCSSCLIPIDPEEE